MRKTKINKTKNVQRQKGRNRPNINNPRGYHLGGARPYSTVENSSISFVDPRKYVSLKYNYTVAQSTATVTGSQIVFRLNSLYDPDAGVGGHQPYGFDSLAAIYNRYRVLKTKYRVQFGTSTGTIHVMCVPVNSTLANSIAGDTTFWTACEMPYAKHRIIGGGGAPEVIIKGTVNLAKLNGVTREQYTIDDRFQAVVTTDPSEILSFYVGYYNPTTSTVVIQTHIELEYFAEFWDPYPLGGSFLHLKPEERKLIETLRREEDNTRLKSRKQ